MWKGLARTSGGFLKSTTSAVESDLRRPVYRHQLSVQVGPSRQSERPQWATLLLLWKILTWNFEMDKVAIPRLSRKRLFLFIKFEAVSRLFAQGNPSLRLEKKHECTIHESLDIEDVLICSKVRVKIPWNGTRKSYMRSITKHTQTSYTSHMFLPVLFYS